MVSPQLVVAVEISWTVVGGQQKVKVSIAIEVGVRQPSANLRLIEGAAEIRSDVAKFSVGLIQKKLWRLGIADIAANIADGFVNVAVGDGEVEPAVQIGIEEYAT